MCLSRRGEWPIFTKKKHGKFTLFFIQERKSMKNFVGFKSILIEHYSSWQIVHCKAFALCCLNLQFKTVDALLFIATISMNLFCTVYCLPDWYIYPTTNWEMRKNCQLIYIIHSKVHLCILFHSTSIIYYSFSRFSFFFVAKRKKKL